MHSLNWWRQNANEDISDKDLFISTETTYSILAVGEVAYIQAVFLNVLIDIHTAIEDKQDKYRFAPYRVVDVVALIEDNASNASGFVVQMPEQGISAEMFHDKAVDFVLKFFGVSLRVVEVV